MSRIDALPADQGAVLQLLLRQGRPYGELSGLLGLDEGEVRRRAHGALDALGPDEAPGLDPGHRADVADYLLGQQDERRRAATYAFLERSAGGRAWARVVGDELRPVAGDKLPAIPDEGRDGVPAAAAASPAAPATAAASPAAPATAAPATTAAAPAASAPAAAAPAPATAAGPPPPRSSRLGGALLLGGIAVVAIGLVLFLVLRGGGGDSPSATPAASTTATQPQAQVEAQINLVPPSNRKKLKALGVVLVQRAQGEDQIIAAVQGLPKPTSGGYGIWLYSGPGKAQWLGFFASQDSQGRLLARGRLKAAIGDYREVLVTREAKGNPARPGPIYLRGPVQTASGAASGG
jgi:anti-sigma-K factor RskA